MVSHHFKVIRHVFGFGIEFFENKDIGIFGHFIVIDFIKRYSYHTYFSPISTPDFVDLELGILSVMANDAFLWIIPYSQHCFLWNFVFYSRKAYLAHQCKKMLYHPYLYRSTIDENPIPLQRICVLIYLCLLLTKVLFEHRSSRFNKIPKADVYQIIQSNWFCVHIIVQGVRGCVKIKKNMDLTNMQREVTFAPHIWP